MRKRLFSCTVWVLVLSAISSFWFGCNRPDDTPLKPQESLASSPAPSTPPAQSAMAPVNSLDLRTAIIRVAQQTIPAVVHIEVTERRTVPNPMLPFESDPFFRYFFNFRGSPRELQREVKGLGTGMLIDAQGHILTNNHVAGGATKIAVLLDNGKKYPATLVGADPKTDLAVIKIDASETLPCVTFGDSDKVEVGEWVVAIGHPRGLDQTVTQGIISAKHRQGITDPNTYQDFLQTDAAINPGNSGGPLLNLNGEVIGVNAAIASQSGGSEGIGFAIPSTMATHVAKALIAHGKVERGWLGVTVQDLTPDLAQTFGVKFAHGALVSEVAKNGPAEKAGLKQGDIIIAYNGKEVPDSAMLRNEAASTPGGEKASVSIIRDGKEQEIMITAGKLEDATQALAASLKDRLGAEFTPVSSKEVKKYRLPAQQGVVITRLDPQGALAEAGLEKNDIILAINRQPIADIEDLIELMRTIPPRQPAILFVLDHRTGNTGSLKLMLP